MVGSLMYRLDFATLIENLKDIVYLIDEDGRVVYCNRAVKEIVGYSPEEIIGKPIFELFTPETARMSEAYFRARLKGEDVPPRYRIDLITADGEVRKCEVFASAFTKEDGSKWAQGIIRDLTELIDLRESLERRVKKLETLRKFGMAAITTSSCDEFYEKVLEALDSLFDLPVKVVAEISRKERQMKILKSQTHLEGWQCGDIKKIPESIVDELARRKEPFVIDSETFPALKHTEFDLGAGIWFPVMEQKERLIGILVATPEDRSLDFEDWDMLEATHLILEFGCRNITLREDLNRSLTELKAYNDLIFHDIMNYIMPIEGYLELALENFENPDGRRFLEKAILSVKKFTDFVEKVRTFIRILQVEKPQLKPVSLMDAVCGAIEMVKMQYPTANIKVGPGLRQVMERVKVLADDLLPHIFLNLLSNSVKFSAPDEVIIDGEIDGTICRITVTDRGPGIPDEEKTMVFDRLYSKKGKRKESGWGLGLAIVANLVERYGGKVWIEDRVPGDHTKGVKFIVELNVASSS